MKLAIIRKSSEILDDLQMRLHLKSPSDWGKVTVKQFFQFGGSGLLNHYNASLFHCLKANYKGIVFFVFYIQYKKSNGKENGLPIFLDFLKGIGIP